MKKFIAVLLSLTLLAGCVAVLAACGKEKGTPISGGDVLGGWTKAESPEITEEFKQVFDKAVATLAGVEYTPVAYVASQVVAGKNHCVLCKAAATVPGAEANYALVYIYEDLQGNASVTGVKDGAPAELSENDGGWSEPASPAVTEDALSAAGSFIRMRLP